MKIILAATLALAMSASVLAAPLPGGDRRVELSAREQPVGAFLAGLFSRIGVPAAVSPGVSGAVNGRFEGSASEVASRIASAYNLAIYYDGAVAHVYPSSAIGTRTFPGAGARDIRAAAADLGLTDNLNRLRQTRGGLLVASGVPRFLDQVAEIASAVGVPKSATGSFVSRGVKPVPLAFRVFPLRYGWAQDVTMRVGDRETVVPGIASILRSMVTPSGGGALIGGQGDYRERYLPPTVPSMRGYDTRPSPNSDERLGYPPVGNGFSPAAYRPAAFQQQAYVQTATPEENAVRIQADKRLNAVIVRDTPDRLQIYEELIAALDQEPQMVEIEATIIDIDVDRARALGINWRLSDGDDVSVGFGNGTRSDRRLLPGTDVDDITPFSRGLSISSIIGSDLQLFSRINALAERGAAKIVTRPQVLTLSNNEAIFDQTETFYVQVAGEDEVDLFNISAGTALRVTPHVFADNDAVRIRLLVTIEDGAIQFNRNVDDLPTVRKSAVNTQALILEGESLLLGGLTQQIETTRTVKVPLLGDIPILEYLFKTNSVSTRRVERLFLISPRIADTRMASLPPSLDQSVEELRNGMPLPKPPEGE
ncbi:type III secretion system outer membrane ring subunit SctC [Pacificimonas sp. WHA3]|uniref:Type 3 secretion system secretin n=1 Tax=Pacificimonas pallii TaxID=2827236 RepID=A0ABS6SEZ5_9SPHN|nr:type III secretion system outer membrane ring subunit SctC [Pacificimonas pallii]MBV7256957.1 type III secretion system outer membrane ring subunit SctC [Pacificimonas pallii]